MKTHILTGLIFAGILATSAVQAAMPSSIGSVEAHYSGLSETKVQQIHKASEQQMAAHKSTCAWHGSESNVVDQLHSPYPGSESNFGEKDYLAAANFNFEC